MPTIQVADMVKFRPTIRKDSVAWDLTGATVTFTFIPPTATQFDRAATIQNAAQGIAYYVTTTSEISEAGLWKLFVKVVDALSEQLTSPTPLTFPVLGVQ